jgi:hypothetical protein
VVHTLVVIVIWERCHCLLAQLLLGSFGSQLK